MSDWRLAWRLARRELNLRFRGLRLLLACLFLGVGALAAIGSLTRAIDDELARRGSAILGGDVEFAASQRAATPQERSAMARFGTVSETVRMQSMAVRGTTSVPIQLKGVDAAYPLYGTLAVRGTSAARRDARTVWIAPTLAQRLRVAAGGTVRLGSADFVVGGIVADEPDRLGEGFTLGPVAIVSMAGIARTGLIQPGSLYESKYRIRMPAGASPRTAADRMKAAFPAGGWETKTRDRAAPGAERFIDRMGQFLLLVGLSALVIAGIGVGNGVSSYLAARRGSIAALKVLGATSGMIAKVYLLQVAVVSGIGIVAGLVAGAAAVPLLVTLAGDVLPVAPSFAVQPVPLVLAAAYGMLIALAFTAPPLIEAGSIPAAGLLRGTFGQRPVPLRRTLPWVVGAGAAIVALALGTAEQPLLSAGFLAAVAGVLLVLAGFGWIVRRGAARLPRPKRPLLRLAIAALYRPGARTGTLVVALGLGLTLFVLLAAIRTSIDANIARTVPQRAPSLFALDVPPAREAEFRRVVEGVAIHPVIRTVPAMRGTITGYGTTRVADLKTLPEGAWALRGERGLTYSAILPEGSELTAGKLWPRDYAGPPLVSIDARLAEVLALKIGDPISYSLLGVERSARIASFRRISWDTLGFNYVMVFSPNAIEDAPHNLAATIDLAPGQEGMVMRALLPRFPSVSVIEVRGVIGQIRDIVSQMATAITAAASVAILAGIAVLIGAIAAAREARTYDGVILRTLGATRLQVLGVQALEYAFLSIVLSALALLLGLGGAWYVVTQLFSFAWLPDYAVVLATLVGGAVMTMAIGLLGAWPILGARPASALRQL
ncbi:FtsX-like permease family protein [Sphingomonas ginsenosidivorax]|uniref:FtsX-like permease family protein n=1 Tax=Sphingomonas ginsenosidivorax TaxID=862135 RepID=A0A5C6UET3_9SPHN|nr:FtsX-like permease family protein [Sphingomonas ginsenosidivorax]TXC70731.1 FtsX-like permease family protein [Sphingomonas ginsenosidivorax]